MLVHWMADGGNMWTWRKDTLWMINCLVEGMSNVKRLSSRSSTSRKWSIISRIKSSREVNPKRPKKMHYSKIKNRSKKNHPFSPCNFHLFASPLLFSAISRQIVVPMSCSIACRWFILSPQRTGTRSMGRSNLAMIPCLRVEVVCVHHVKVNT